MTRLVEGKVDRLRCRSCGSITSNAVFSGENDVVTMDLISLASLARQEVVIAEAEGSEFAGGYENCVSSVQRRISTALGRNDLCVVVLLRTEVDEKKGPMRFGGFFPVEHKWEVIYRCPHCGGEAISERSESFAKFQREGGALTVVGDMQLQS